MYNYYQEHCVESFWMSNYYSHIKFGQNGNVNLY